MLAIATLATLSGCTEPDDATPVSFPFMYLQHPMGTIGIGMTSEEIEDILGVEPEYVMPLEGAILADYEIPNIIILYDDITDRAVLIRTFSYGITYNGVTIGMDYSEVLAILGENAFESFIPERNMMAVALFYDESGEQTTPHNLNLAYAVTFEFGEEGVVNRLEIETFL